MAATLREPGANLGFEQTTWAAADKLRGHLDAAEHKHVVLGEHGVGDSRPKALVLHEPCTTKAL